MKNTIYGYCRISTMKQSITRQIENIKAAYPDAIIFDEVFTGTKMTRPKFEKLLKMVRPGDTIIFDEVSRMARDAEEGTRLYFELYNKGVNLVFIKERHIDTDSYKDALKAAGIHIETDDTAEGVLVSDIVKAINRFTREKVRGDIRKAFDAAEGEVKRLRVRTSEGMKAAGASNVTDAQGNIIEYGSISKARQGMKVTTKKSIEMKAKIFKMSRDFDGNMNDREIMEILNISRNTYYKYKKALAAEA